ncbi:glyoxylate/hydroxypyruvate reductase A [Marinobacter salinisoli]|uniref:Glyoxylate/hydroxypyruvate reductase A n=1 Tax=Marinobacter salinisoli TaxID=2769486 RepID=A0ABX7MTN2_9GAMM|nr:glyoxylate/hydroxypyruvate reductase A [Marinobacter salinisoli]QSP95742.1 glyoxylate/hydroxypyruvate reductase A [Marinobacter salinisoli]
MKILFVAGDPKPERWTAPLQQRLPDADLQVWDPDGPATNADYAIVWNPPAELFEREPQLKAIFSLGAGVDKLVSLPAVARGLTVVRVEDAGMSVQMAEYVLYHLLESSRQMDLYRDQQAQAHWKIHRPIRREDWPVGVMGLGQIGSRVASALASLDYPVSGWARSPHQLAGVITYHGADGLGDFLSNTRVLVNTLPLTDHTRNLMDYDLLSQLQPGALVINVGRGEQLVDQDLLQALDEGHVARAVLDVFRQEPLPTDHPFWTHPKVTVTPHISARTLRETTIDQIADKIRAHADGKPVSGVVDIQRGY